MTRNRKLIAGAVGLALVVGGGAAIAANELSSPPAAAPSQRSYGSGFGFGNSDGPAFGNGSGFRGSGFGAGGGFFGNLSSAAAYLGVSRATLKSDLESGETLAQVTKDEGKPVSGLVDALVSAQKRQLAAAVASGRLTKAFARSIESRLTDRITSLVDGIRPVGARRGFGRGSKNRPDQGSGSGTV